MLLAGCQAPNHASTPYPSTQESSVRDDADPSSSRWADEQLAQQNVWDFIGNELKLDVPNNERIRSQKITLLA
ncbi:hypothetical protein PCI56_14165 [Plesiomonas shigelloides subsp. oncorhynchi]|nr:hypothetical protein [Plesiomonas shigelloides]